MVLLAIKRCKLHKMQSEKAIWSRGDISTCNCSEKTYRHVHCPCLNCNGRAADRGTELRHWREVSLINIEHEVEEDVGAIADQSACQCSVSESEHEAGFESDCEGQQQMETDNVVDSDTMDILSHDNEQTDNLENPMRKLVVTAVLDALKIKRNSGVSIQTFEDILEYAKKLLISTLHSENVDREVLTTLWPKSWSDVQSLLKKEGFEGAKQYYICICRQEKRVRQDSEEKRFSYSGKYSIMENRNDVCIHCGNTGYLTYYYLGLNSKVKNWFRSKTICEQMLSHWKERSHWLGETKSWPLKCEIWDGQRWVDLQWFWDPEKTWPLPTLCPSCGIPVSTNHLSNSPTGPSGREKRVECPECFNIFEDTIKFTNGNPLNLALIGHWDGWQPFGYSLRGCGSIEVSIANMRKEDRNHVDEVYVVGFVPSYAVPNIPEALDPFLQPLMDDICT